MHCRIAKHSTKCYSLVLSNSDSHLGVTVLLILQGSVQLNDQRDILATDYTC